MMYKTCRVKKRKRIKLRLFVALAVIAAIFIGVYIFIIYNVDPIIINVANEKIRAITANAVSEAVLDVMSSNANVDYMTVIRSDDGTIKSVDINADVVSSLAQKITIESQKRINESGQEGIRIPIGSLSGITVFTGLGPDVNIKLYLVGSTKTQIVSVFTDTGINQTLHRLYFNISGSVAVTIPGLPSTVDTSTQVLMSEMIIVGDVPPTYLNSSNIGDMLDLVPN